MIAQMPVRRHGGSDRSSPLNGSRDDAALAVQKQKRDHADQWRQRGGERRHRLQESPSAKIHAAEHEGERQADGGRADHRADRDDERRPQRLAIARAVREFAPVAEPVREGAGDDRDVGIDDAPEQQREHGSRERPRDALVRLRSSCRHDGHRLAHHAHRHLVALAHIAVGALQLDLGALVDAHAIDELRAGEAAVGDDAGPAGAVLSRRRARRGGARRARCAPARAWRARARRASSPRRRPASSRAFHRTRPARTSRAR